MVQRRGAGRVATEHPRDLRGPLIPGDDGGGGARATTAHALGHPHVLVRQRGDGSQMRDTEHLPYEVDGSIGSSRCGTRPGRRFGPTKSGIQGLARQPSLVP